MRPIGAFVFGRAADRYGRRPTLVVVIVLYSFLELVSAFSSNLVFLICVRALFGIAMGGVWGVGSSLTMETIPPSARGIISGLLQAGYPAGYLSAALVYALLPARRVARPVRARRGAGIALHLCDAKRSGIDGLDG